MRIDAQTLRELELFEGPEGGTSIFDGFIRTLTKGGERRLRKRFENPLKTLDEILTVQQTLRFLRHEPEAWLPSLSGRQERLIEEYLFSGIETVSSGWRALAAIQGLKQTFIYRHFDQIEVGCQETWRCLRDFHQLWQRHRPREKTPLLEKIWGQAEILFSDQQLQAVWKPKPSLSFGDIFVFDRLFRAKCFSQVKQLIGLIFELDALTSMSQICKELRLNFPEFENHSEPQLEIEALVHPRLIQAIPNSIKLDSKTHFLVLTGPNMGGKTTFLKACALAVYLAHLGMGVPAQRMKLTCFKGLMTSLQNHDNLELGYSYFYSEVRRVKQAAELIRQEKQVLVIFDELFRGTNLQDAFDASLEIIRRLSLFPQVLCILSSHLIELVPQIQNLPGMQFFCFKVTVHKNSFDFDYQLYPGISEHKIGLAILKSEGVLELLEP
ncbi:hypothetical protein COW36_20500 [bacterium (Candidatus Blackallbacteria) CG17_big_fil_post_rev_8_21_14_2_50_48_46]|uniref:DNA mismatch repair proteins mutS family domain-containing protein n=1 Tax=bacterium (Candidatus Blackallbacteria) CG17_big_fil_post_rev_8_21_14_2_50_48_46 TaxID=2014261 RepID=A0A2M7FZF8_9BACT|nr:MAG: hypothetical protein COW64_22825 [bacterium (Candidatus Blackallbacteria) CG18_big_fil_WC_8_21_14_2_50_49_26]PIW14786.1 MAG: hypothetical protein COW36_20500 [bacterium (Candidatus Blackallbacteria) CG17_big_fil_post_rev_8_21_14_2_50_48_46]PIW50888.1 MAG: hypothetical protein COW20_01315 [bacterium (Candidatus Blackallbacteria) CG13_big_fil_rev_8_21_14_2_50_49_14]